MKPAPSDVYLIDRNKKYQAVEPSPVENLMKLYGLESTADALARTNRDGSKKVRLRKSYKKHIADLPGKHNIPAPKPIPNGLLDPMIGQAPNIIKPIDTQLLQKALDFERSHQNGLPGIDKADLAIGQSQDGSTRREDGSDDDDDGRKRKKRQINGEVKRQHT